MTPLAPSSLLLPSRSHPRSIETSFQSISAGALSNSYMKIHLRKTSIQTWEKLQGPSSSPRKHGKNVMCYRCGEKGHLAEICRKEATRFVCGAFGHRSFYCPRRGKQGNQVILFLVLQPYEDMVRNVEHLRKCAVSLRGRASLSKASFWRKSVPSIWIQFQIVS